MKFLVLYNYLQKHKKQKKVTVLISLNINSSRLNKEGEKYLMKRKIFKQRLLVEIKLIWMVHASRNNELIKI
jgi:hypothetical protein